MAGSEAVFNIIQMGPQAGTAYAPGSPVPATVLWPVEAPVKFDLNRASQYPVQDWGKNIRNHPGTGYNGIRESSATLVGEVSFEDVMDILEMSFAGGVAPVGLGPYVWTYVFETGTPTLIPRTIEGGSTDAAQQQMRLDSCLVDQLTIGFADITGPGAYPWKLSANVFGMDREISPITASLASRTGRETVQGHLTRLYEGPTSTVFASLAELAGSLKGFTATFTRSLSRRAYGGSSDSAARFGFKQPSSGTVGFKVGVSATSKSDFHDVWNAASPAPLGERRIRAKATGSGTKSLTLDGRVALFAVPVDEVDGERVFDCTGEWVDDSTLGGPAQIAVSNSIAGPL